MHVINTHKVHKFIKLLLLILTINITYISLAYAAQHKTFMYVEHGKAELKFEMLINTENKKKPSL